MKRNEHLEWAKKRAFEIIDQDNAIGAWTSFVSDLQKHDDLRYHIAIELGMMTLLVSNFDKEETRKFIDGFN